MIKTAAGIAFPMTKMQGSPRPRGLPRTFLAGEAALGIVSALGVVLVSRLIFKHLEQNLAAEEPIPGNLATLSSKLLIPGSNKSAS